MKVSFIIPIYKVEKYIDECVSSILNQTYTDYEIILVDDGSPDACPQICDGLAAKDGKVKVLHKKNGGLSDARSAGVEIASGDYVIFVDGDDFWTDKDSLKNLVDTVGLYPECDFVNFNCSYYYSESDSYKKWKLFDPALCKPADKNSVLKSLVKSGVVPMSACLKIIKRTVFSEKGLTFIKGIHCEDIPWFINLLDVSDRCVFVNQYIYAYRQNVSGSISFSFGEKSFNDLLTIIRTETEKMDKRSFSEDAKKALLSFLAYEFCILLGYIHRLPENLRNHYRTRLLEYRWLLDYKDNPKVKMVKVVSDLFGMRATEYILGLYMKHH